jgi:outer membrane protein OmpA-like peptidoglycan-associated protein
LPSLGGLDIYRAIEDTLTNRWTVVHLPAPVNSQGDDFGMTFDGFHNRGFFSSNRSTGGRGWDKIYSFSYPEVLQTVQGWVYEQDGYELPEAQVYMIGDDGTNVKLSVRSDGSFEQPVKPGVKYLFLATCRGYLNARNELVADSLEVEHRHVLQFPLPSTNIPVLVRNVFYEFNRADLTPESTAALDRLAAMLQEHPNITIELAAHCDYRGDDKYNMKLSQRRAESVVKYLTEKGIQADRLTAKGYGESLPKRVNKKLLEKHPFLHENDTLSEAYILALPTEQQEACNALNRRTEFRVLRTTYGMFEDVQVKSVDAEANRKEE